MTLSEAIIHAKEVSQDQNLCLACREEHKQLVEWLTELQVYQERERSKFRMAHPECFHQCRNRGTRVICLHCTRNNFAPSGEDKRDYFNQDVDISIFEKKKGKKS